MGHSLLKIEVSATVQSIHFFMISSENFPQRFAMLRTQGDNRPYLQVLQAESLDEFEGHIPICFFQDLVVNPNTIFHVERSNMNDRNIYQVYSIASGVRTDEIFYYWYVPYVVGMNGEYIQIIDFQYKSWLPMAQNRVLTLGTEGYNLIDAANEKAILMCERIHAAVEQRIQTPPRRLAAAHQSPRLPTAPPRTPPAAMSPRYRLLPSTIGQILIRNARAGLDNCPITYAQYSEIDMLSITSCYHIFDRSALENWENLGHESCPLCRERITNVIHEEIYT